MKLSTKELSKLLDDESIRTAVTAAREREVLLKNVKKTLVTCFPGRYMNMEVMVKAYQELHPEFGPKTAEAHVRKLIAAAKFGSEKEGE